MNTNNRNFDLKRAQAETPGFALHGIADPRPHRCVLCRDDATYHSARGGWRCSPHHQELYSAPQPKKDAP